MQQSEFFCCNFREWSVYWSREAFSCHLADRELGGDVVLYLHKSFSPGEILLQVRDRWMHVSEDKAETVYPKALLDRPEETHFQEYIAHPFWKAANCTCVKPASRQIKLRDHVWMDLSEGNAIIHTGEMEVKTVERYWMDEGPRLLLVHSGSEIFVDSDPFKKKWKPDPNGGLFCNKF